MKLAKIKDNSLNIKDELSIVPNLVNRISNKTIEQLDKEGIFIFPEIITDAEDISKEQMVLQGINGSYQSGNIMGFIGYGEERLIIRSRFGNEDNDYFFQYLLERVLDFPNVVDLNTDANNDNELFSMLVFLFPHYLKSAMRKGTFKTYIRKEYNDVNVKGTIDISRHIKVNTPFVGNIAYSQREYSYDNYLTELIRHTIEFIKRKPYGQKVLHKAKDEVKEIINITQSYELYDKNKIVNLNKNNIIRHAYYREYRMLQRLCILILQSQKHQFGFGNREVYGILFDGAWLWEEYINLLIKDAFYHPENKTGKGKQKLFSNENSKVGLIYPDFISKDSNNRIIADAKYKPINSIGNRDYLQVLAYMYRFDAKQGFYLYPNSIGTEDSKLFLNSGSTYEKDVKKRDDIFIVKKGLSIPNRSINYSSFKNEIKKSEVDFCRYFV